MSKTLTFFVLCVLANVVAMHANCVDTIAKSCLAADACSQLVGDHDVVATLSVLPTFVNAICTMHANITNEMITEIFSTLPGACVGNGFGLSDLIGVAVIIGCTTVFVAFYTSASTKSND